MREEGRGEQERGERREERQERREGRERESRRAGEQESRRIRAKMTNQLDARLNWVSHLFVCTFEFCNCCSNFVAFLLTTVSS